MAFAFFCRLPIWTSWESRESRFSQKALLDKLFPHLDIIRSRSRSIVVFTIELLYKTILQLKVWREVQSTCAPLYYQTTSVAQRYSCLQSPLYCRLCEKRLDAVSPPVKYLSLLLLLLFETFPCCSAESSSLNHFGIVPEILDHALGSSWKKFGNGLPFVAKSTLSVEHNISLVFSKWIFS